MNRRQVRLTETFEAIGGPVARLGRTLREDVEAIIKPEADKSGYDLLATDGFLQRFQQVADLTLRKLFPRLLATRNRLVHEYAMEEEERSRELRLALAAARRLHAEVIRIRDDRTLGRKIFGHD